MECYQSSNFFKKVQNLMKICYLSNSAIPSSFASSIQIVKMCEAFSQLGNDVLLITTNVKKNNFDLFNFYNVKHKFSFKKIENFTEFPLGIKYYLFSLISILESFKFKPNIYITRNFFTCFLLILFKKKTIIELHHDLNTESRIVRFLVKYLKFLNSKYLQKAIAITNSVGEEYIGKKYIQKRKVIVLPSGSSLKQIKIFKKREKNFNIGYFGSLYKSRGLDLIIKLAKIDKANEYHLYGDLKDIKYLRYKNSIKNLHLKNHVPYKNIPEKLSKMDILILPYVSSITVAGDVGDITKYTSPLKLFDYLSAGKVIVCSDYKVLKEVINNKNAIFIRNYRNIYSWKNEINRLSCQPQKQFIMSKNNYNLSKEFSLKERAKKILKEMC